MADNRELLAPLQSSSQSRNADGHATNATYRAYVFSVTSGTSLQDCVAPLGLVVGPGFDPQGSRPGLLSSVPPGLRTPDARYPRVPDPCIQAVRAVAVSTGAAGAIVEVIAGHRWTSHRWPTVWGVLTDDTTGRDSLPSLSGVTSADKFDQTI